jgi:hypothetical protein
MSYERTSVPSFLETCGVLLKWRTGLTLKAVVPSFVKIDLPVQIKLNVPVGSVVLAAMILKYSIFWDITPYSPLKVN